jgi:hypothetical protein
LGRLGAGSKGGIEGSITTVSVSHTGSIMAERESERWVINEDRKFESEVGIGIRKEKLSARMKDVTAFVLTVRDVVYSTVL